MKEVKTSEIGTNEEIISNEWKHSLEVNPSTSIVSLVSLYDLLYDSDTGKHWQNTEKAGIKLDHDIILLNRNIFDENGDISFGSTWKQNGIDISLPVYDSRARQASFADATFKIEGTSIFENDTYILYDKDSATAPLNKQDFMKHGVLVNLRPTSADLTKSDYIPPNICNYEEFNEPNKGSKSSIVLTSRDEAFKSVVEISNKEAYNRLYLNQNTTYSAFLIVRALGINRSLFSEGVSGVTSDLTKVKFSADDFNMLAKIEKFLSDEGNTNGKGNVWKKILKNTFVWVRASFFGDYIVPDSFQQNLTKNSNVIHNELMISGAADFKKYDTYSSKSIKPSEESEPYVPITSPTVDFYTSEFLDKYFKDSNVKVPTTEGNYSSKINADYASELVNFLKSDELVNNPVVKGLPIATVVRQSGEESTLDDKSIAPPNYFDTEVRNYNDYFRSLNKFPTVLPPDGNIYIDGRIISPTIDEIWYMLKKLVGGRASDIENTGTTNQLANLKGSRADKIDMGFPFGSTEISRNESDTTMTEVRDSEFNFSINNASPKKGDPIGFEYDRNDEGEVTTLKVTRFVNQNDSIVYPIYKLLKEVSKKVTVIDPERDITKFAAWNLHKWSDDIDDSKLVNDNDTIVDGVWKPREVPYSLRELEAIGLSNKYNIITLARFIQNNFSIVGKLGKKVENPLDPNNNVAGSLYQFHKDYNYSIDKPNSYFNNKGSDSGYDENGNPIGIKVSLNEEPETDGLIHHDKYYMTGGDLKVGECMSNEVYLAADGTWRYINDHIKIPILKCDY